MSEEKPGSPEQTPAPAPPPVEAPRPMEGMPDFSQPPPPAQFYRPHPGQQAYGPMDRLIPTKNTRALLAYYFGVFSIVPCFTPVLGPTAIVLGILGLKECKRDPNLPGKGHAITGIVIGSFMLMLVLFAILVVVLNAKRSPLY